MMIGNDFVAEMFPSVKACCDSYTDYYLTTEDIEEWSFCPWCGHELSEPVDRND